MRRNGSIDVLRIISAIAVLSIHVISACGIGVGNESIVDGGHLEGAHELLKWSVPVFFMITGYCLLCKETCTYRYCFQHVGKYLGVLCTLGLFYALLEEVFNARTINASVLKNSVLNVISGKLWDHMWFVYAIIGVYLVMPVLHSFISQSAENAWLLTGLLFFFTILAPLAEPWITLGVQLPLGDYLFYVCLGSTVARYGLEKRWNWLIVLAGVIGTSWIVLAYRQVDFGYRHLAVCLMAVSVFLLISRQHIRVNSVVQEISKCTWGIYLIHPLFINLAMKVLHMDLLSSAAVIGLTLFAGAVFALSLTSTYIARRIPYIKKLL